MHPVGEATTNKDEDELNQPCASRTTVDSNLVLHPMIWNPRLGCPHTRPTFLEFLRTTSPCYGLSLRPRPPRLPAFTSRAEQLHHLPPFRAVPSRVSFLLRYPARSTPTGTCVIFFFFFPSSPFPSIRAAVASTHYIFVSPTHA
jgi:hypothetical protein